jgi:membrane protein
MAMPPSPLETARRLLLTVYAELFRTQVFTVAAALAFFFLLAFIPLLVVMASLLAYLPLPNLFGQLLLLISSIIPADAMQPVARAMNGLLTPGKGKLIGFGLVGSLWAASGGFSASIDALNIAYDAASSRPWWRDRLQALLLTVTVGGLATSSLVLIILGPKFGTILTNFFNVSWSTTRFWPVLRLGLIFSTYVAAVTLLYFLAPTVKQRLSATLPGAVLAVTVFLFGSFGLSFYIFHFSQYATAYGVFGAVIALMLWLYLVAIAILVGAEINAELLKLRGHFLPGQRHLPPGPLLPNVGISMPAFAEACAIDAQREAQAAADANSGLPAHAESILALNTDGPLAADLAAKDGL